jgi:prepilin peptidase CpaA
MSTETAALTRPIQEVRSAPVAWTVACALGSCVLVSGRACSTPLPELFWAAAFLFFVVASDVRFHRVPNLLTMPAFVCALIAAPLIGANAGLTDTLIGATLGFALLIGPYALGGVGAGDVKALMALGAWVGAETILGATAWAMIAAGTFGIASLALSGELLAFAKRWGQIAIGMLTLRRNVYVPPAAGSQAAGGIPFAAALAVGLAAQFFGGLPW